MRFDDLMIYMIEDYVRRDIEYIEGDLSYDEQQKARDDLDYLDNLNIDDYINIYHNIQENTDLIDKINETIHDYLYSYRRDK